MVCEGGCSGSDLFLQLHARRWYHQILSQEFHSNYKTENNLQRVAVF